MTTCVKCPEKATKTYHPLKPMCEKHYNDIINTVNIISNAGKRLPINVQQVGKSKV